MTSRVSFLEDSPQVRRLMDGTSLMSEKLVQQLHAQGVDPLRVPRFSVLRLRDDPAGRFAAGGAAGPRPGLLAATAGRAARGRPEPARSGRDGGQVDLAEPAVAAHHAGRRAGLLPPVAQLLRAGVPARRDDVHPGRDWSTSSASRRSRAARVGVRRLPARRRCSGPPVLPVPATPLRWRSGMSAYQELLAAEFLRTPQGRDAALAAAARPRLTEQVRRVPAPPRAAVRTARTTASLPAGVYLVGPSHHLMLRRIERPVRFDRFPGHRRPVQAVPRRGRPRTGRPGGITRTCPRATPTQPWRERLRVPGYYDDPAYADHPAIAVNWWSAYAFARFEGKRLPTSLEWEAAARGADGRLFPWGDQVDLSAVELRRLLERPPADHLRGVARGT